MAASQGNPGNHRDSGRGVVDHMHTFSISILFVIFILTCIQARMKSDI